MVFTTACQPAYVLAEHDHRCNVDYVQSLTSVADASTSWVVMRQAMGRRVANIPSSLWLAQAQYSARRGEPARMYGTASSSHWRCSSDEYSESQKRSRCQLARVLSGVETAGL